MGTRIVKSLPVERAEIEAVKREQLVQWVSEAAAKVYWQFVDLVKATNKKLNASPWVLMDNKNVWYSNDVVGVWPRQSPDSGVRAWAGTDTCSEADYQNCSDWWKNKNKGAFQFEPSFPSKQEVTRCFDRGVISPFKLNGSGKKNDDFVYFNNGKSYWNGVVYIDKAGHHCYLRTNKNGNGYYKQGTGYDDWNLYIPIYRLNGEDAEPPSAAQALLLWAKNGLRPNGEFFDNDKNLWDAFCKLEDFWQNNQEYLAGSEAAIGLNERKLLSDILNGKKCDLISHNTENYLKQTTVSGEAFTKRIKQQLLTCDHRRAALDAYDENVLYDPMRGHWELWDWEKQHSAGNDGASVELDEGFTARDPADDVNEGIVAIDFGTKSTVVVFENERLERLPLQIGCGSYHKSVNPKNYENPTIVQFIDANGFIAAYKSRAGRPETSWEQVTVSHTALDNLNSSSSEKYKSFFDGLKQWCGSAQMRAKIKDEKGTTFDLPPFLELAEELNPVEIYAYYLGLFINIMVQEKHIFLHYIMSFPVSFDSGTKEKIRSSFECGIKKSLPTALLDNAEKMREFSVVEGGNEPAAYAITALETYGFEPDGDEENYYGVFDFGGGTTDFDFGVLRPSALDRYDFDLLHFGANGDRTLGGENILRLLAFEVFKANRDTLLNPGKDSKVKIPFTYAAEKEAFPGNESLINETSQEAQRNMRSLMECLRPLWEEPESETARRILAAGVVKPNLYGDDGRLRTEISLVLPGCAFEKIAEEAVTAEEASIEELLEEGAEESSIELAKVREAIKRARPNDLGTLVTLREKEARLVAEAWKTNKRQTKLKKKEDDGISRAAENLPVGYATDEPEVLQIIRRRVERGVRKFFIALHEAFEKCSDNDGENKIKALSQVQEINIFLAGNSSRTKFVTEIFNEYIASEGKARKLLLFAPNQKMPQFNLFPTLGTAKADALLRKRGINPGTDNLARPTGKTGVAYGLLRCRDGGNIRVLDIVSSGSKDMPFQFYVGRNRRQKFKTIIDRSARYDRWYKFIDASGPFDLLYTDNPEAITNEASARIACKITVSPPDALLDAESFVFIRPCDRKAVEYIIAKSEAEAENRIGKPAPVRIELEE